MGGVSVNDGPLLTGEDGGKVPVTRNLWFAIFLITSQSFVYGNLLGSLNASLVTGEGDNGEACFNHDDDVGIGCPIGSIYDDFDLTTIEASMAVAVLFVSGWAASLNANIPLEYFGRKKTMLINACVLLAGALLTASGNFACLFIGRIVSGWGGGTVTVMCPVLLSEIAHPTSRGTVTAVYQVTVTGGIFMIAVFGFIFVTYVHHGWQFVQGMTGIPPLLVLTLSHWIPESPKWLVRRGFVTEAEETITHLRPEGFDITPEMDAIRSEMKPGAKEEEQATWEEVFVSKRRIFMGCLMMWLQSITGINSITFYSTTIFGFAGFNQAILATASTGAMNCFMSFVSSTMADKVSYSKTSIKCLRVFECSTYSTEQLMYEYANRLKFTHT